MLDSHASTFHGLGAGRCGLCLLKGFRSLRQHVKSTPETSGNFSTCNHMSYGLNSLKGVIQGEYHSSVIKGDTRSLDYSSYS